jgi:hypothetical protein
MILALTPEATILLPQKGQARLAVFSSSRTCALHAWQVTSMTSTCSAASSSCASASAKSSSSTAPAAGAISLTVLQ